MTSVPGLYGFRPRRGDTGSRLTGCSSREMGRLPAGPPESHVSVRVCVRTAYPSLPYCGLCYAKVKPYTL
eukprot:scaffold75035_cov56-Phaeocystis_antarctica.AAC.7